jgi:hypothetical protein
METHSAIIQISKDSIAFINGIPDTCEHDYKDDVFIAASGKVIHWYTYRDWAGYTAEMRNDLIREHHIKNDDPIVIATSECRKCHKIYSPPIHEI